MPVAALSQPRMSVVACQYISFTVLIFDWLLLWWRVRYAQPCSSPLAGRFHLQHVRALAGCCYGEERYMPVATFSQHSSRSLFAGNTFHLLYICISLASCCCGGGWR